MKRKRYTGRYSVELVTKAGKRYIFISRSRAGAISDAENIARVGLSGAHTVRPSQIRSITFRIAFRAKP